MITPDMLDNLTLQGMLAMRIKKLKRLFEECIIGPLERRQLIDPSSSGEIVVPIANEVYKITTLIASFYAAAEVREQFMELDLYEHNNCKRKG